MVGSQIVFVFVYIDFFQEQTLTLLWNTLAFFRKPILNNPSVMCHCASGGPLGCRALLKS